MSNDLAATGLVTVGSRDNIRPAYLANITDMFSDSFFWYGLHSFLQLHLPHAAARTFQYQLAHVGIFCITQIQIPCVQVGRWHLNLLWSTGLLDDDALTGVGHADELWLQFEPYIGISHDLPAEDQAVSRQITRTRVQQWCLDLSYSFGRAFLPLQHQNQCFF